MMTFKYIFTGNTYIDAEIFIETRKVTYRKLEIGKVVTQPVKIYVLYTHLNPKKGTGKPKKGYGVMTKKGRASVGKIRGCVTVESNSYFLLLS